MRILIYGDGISNKAVKGYLEEVKISYDTIDDGNEYDYIIKSPGIKKELVEAKGKIITDIELYYLLKSDRIIGITGTNGKTTTTMLVNDMLSHKYKSVVAGNIGIPVFNVIKGNELKVFELSSFELDGCDLFKPKVALLLNISPAHLDYHKSYEEYWQAKYRLVENMEREDLVIYNLDDKDICLMVEKTKAKMLSFSLDNKKADIYIENSKIVLKNKKIRLKGIYSNANYEYKNMMAAILVADAFKVPIKCIKKSLKSFKKPSYRAELVAPNIINDAKSTNIMATYSLVRQYKDVRLICGGYDRGEALDDLDLIIPYVKGFYLYGANKVRVANYLKMKDVNFKMFDTLEEALSIAIAEKEMLIYSPMAPSYDQFKSFEERGRLFNELIKKARN